MTSFEDLPAEVVHYIAQHLAPTCCEDSKKDILAFRAVQKRTWHIANKVAFKYMTLYMQPTTSSKLGIFSRKARADAYGYDIRDSVQEVRYLLSPKLDLNYAPARESKNLFRQKAYQVFSLILNKDEEDLDAKEKQAREHYWELCFKQYMYRPAPGHAIVRRLVTILGRFPNLRSMYADSQHHILNTSSIAWKALEDVGVSNHIWDNSKGCFRQIGRGTEARYTVDVEILHRTLMAALPRTVTVTKSNGFGEYREKPH